MLYFFAVLASAQQTNLNRLPPCPKPDYSKNTDLERFAKWTNCWGRYKVELDKTFKGDVLEGEWLNGTLHGQGTNTYANGDKYVGEYKDGNKNGQGTYTYANGDKYVGEYKDGNKNGQGTYTHANGAKFVGEFKDGKYHGQGIGITADGRRLEGIWENDKFIREAKVNLPNLNNTVAAQTNGAWIDLVKQTNLNRLPPCPKPDYSKNTDLERFAKWTNCWGRYKVELDKTFKGDVLEGEWLNGELNGRGTYTYANGDKYVGEYKDGNKHGQGTYSHASGEKYVGEYKDGKMHGQGTYTYANGDKYVGEFKDGKYHGRGTYTYASGSKYEGEFKDDKSHGQGTYTFAQGHGYSGEWKDGKQHGKGIETHADGRSPNEGIFENGKFVRASKVNLPNLNNNIATSTDRAAVERERQQLAEERKRLDEEKRQREQAKASSQINLQVSATKTTSDGAYTISIQTNTDTASLKINGEEIGGRSDGNYTIKRVARVGQDTNFTITAVDVYGNSESKTITVSRQALPSSAQIAILKPEFIKIAPARDAIAIIIGIQNYKRVPNAEFANNDAREFSEYAIRALGIKPEKIKMLLDDEADEVNIVKAFENWLPIQVNKDKTDVYVFYSGHGLPSSDGKSLYFLPHGVDKELLSRTAVAQSDIIAALTSAKPKSVTMFIDACYSGQTRGGDVLLANAKPVALKSDANAYPLNFTVITASANDQISSSSPELKHGIFSFYLMKGMEGDADANQDGKITVGEMQDYLSEKVSRQATTLGRKQDTQLVGDANKVLMGR